MLLMILACGPKEPPAVAVEAPPPAVSVKPEPLPRTEFVLPEPSVGTLDNGLTVYVVENHEIPVVQVRAVFATGGWTDPVGKEGLASATLDMLNEGAAGKDAVAISKELRALASSVGTGAGLDQASVRADCLKKNLEPTLDVWADVLLRPDFPASDWERLQKQYLLDLEAEAKDPGSMSWKVLDTLMYGETYDGRSWTQDSVGGLTVDDMAGWYEGNINVANGVILVGGDITLDEVVPLLNARLGDLPQGTAAGEPTIETIQPTETTIYLVDKPGAAQSVIKAGRFVPERTDDAWYPLLVGNTAWGGMFMARLNMNLREDKGYTYGARSYTGTSQSAPVWVASSSVQSEVTAESLSEIFLELEEVQGDRPLTADEIAYAQSNRVNGYPASFETVDYLLSSTQDVWLYELPADWNEQYLNQVEAVTPELAQATFVEQVASQPLAIVVVGDLASIQAPIEALGVPTVVVGLDAKPVESE
jgi:zinc protease